MRAGGDAFCGFDLNTLLISHRSGLDHDNGPGHPERPDRVRVIERVLEHEKFMTLIRGQSDRGTREMALRVHPESYVQALELFETIRHESGKA